MRDGCRARPRSCAGGTQEGRKPGFSWEAPRRGPAISAPPTKKPLTRRGLQCERRESNPHVRRHTDLNRARLPISPLSRETGPDFPGSGTLGRTPRAVNPRLVRSNGRQLFPAPPSESASFALSRTSATRAWARPAAAGAKTTARSTEIPLVSSSPAPSASRATLHHRRSLRRPPAIPLAARR